jgi:hypothetical protein
MQEIELAILRYLSAKPEAEDTLQGITEWWLLKQQVPSKAPAVECALAVLVSRGMLSQRAGPHGSVLYRLNARCRAGLEHLLARYSSIETDRGCPEGGTKMKRRRGAVRGVKEHK